MIISPAPGGPGWLELATADLERSTRFYQDVFGWTYQQVTDGTGQGYVIASLFDEPVAGFRGHRAAIRDWTLYLATPDLAATSALAYRLGGGALETRPHVVPGVGAKLLVDDPSGATFGLAQPERGFTAGLPGTLVWAEFVTRQAHLADRFFGALFGYGQRQFGDGRATDYVVHSLGEDSVFGRVRMDPGTPPEVPPRWIAHFEVDPDLGFDRTLHRARDAGARLRFRPYSSTLGKVAVLSDPLGTRFAIIDPALASDWDYRSAADDPYDN
ncbi:VOC family protein [Amycolatopsis lurida]